MSLALCGTAFASSTNSTVSSPTDGDTGSQYSLWKLFDLVELSNGTYVITPVAEYKTDIISAVNTVTGSSLNASSSDYDIQNAISNYTTTHDSTEAQALAKAFYDIVKDETADKTITAANGSTSGTGDVGPGYYVLAETQIGTYNGGDGVATRPILYAVGNSGFTVTTKESYPTPDKTITASAAATIEDSDSTTAQIGTTVTFQLKTTLPSNFTDYNLGYNLVFTDTLSAGLKFNAVTSVTVDGKAAKTSGDGSYVFNDSTWTSGSDTVLTWTWADISKDENAGNSKDVIITYTAIVTGDAVIGSAGNPNTLEITYSSVSCIVPKTLEKQHPESIL